MTAAATVDPRLATAPDLDLDLLRAALGAGHRTVATRYRPNLLRHASPVGLRALRPIDAAESTIHPRSFPPALARTLRAGGLECHRSSEALTAELTFLLRFFAALSGDSAPRLQLRWIDLADAHDRPWVGAPAGPRLALTQVLATSDADGHVRALRLGRDAHVWVPGQAPPPRLDGREAALLAHVTTTRGDVPAADELEAATTPADVLLVTMPFGLIMQPSLGLGLLKAALDDEIASRILYLNLRYALRVGVPFYNWVSHAMPSSMELVGEWIFSAALYGPGDDDAFLTEIVAAENRRWVEFDDEGPFLSTIVADGLMEQFRRARRLAPGFVDECADLVLECAPKLVALTSLFQQQTASLALAQRLKQRQPGLTVVLGGPNCEGIMGVETARRFRFLDAVVLGEGDRVFPEIVARALAGRPLDALPGVYSPAAADRAADDEPRSAPAVAEMDTLPYPDHTDFDAQWGASGLGDAYPVTLLFETARGCWWGQKHHCTFCGLNGMGMAFRSKSPQRALAEYRSLTADHPGCDVATVDNILDMRYFDTFLAELAGSNGGNQLFYEVKANLRRAHVRRLREANVCWIQPGIESLSDQVLGLMQKGVSALHNIQLLKWCQELDVTPLWNIIWGFPGEDPAEYERMAELLPWLTHLCPPMGMGRVQVHRFSPNFFDSRRLGFRHLRPAAAYRHVHPLDQDSMGRLAYFFDYDTEVLGDVRDYTRRLSVEIRAWQDSYRTSVLRTFDRGSSMLVHDGRPQAPMPLIFLSALERAVVLACERVTSTSQLARRVSRTLGAEASEPELQAALRRLEAHRLILRRDGRLLGLALAARDPEPCAREGASPLNDPVEEMP